jgi:FkbM family methyltransferase
MNTELIERGGLKFNVRKETLDEWVVDEVLDNSAYMKHLMVKEGDIVLDIGMNIGVFTIDCINRFATVVSFEPEPENFKLANKNISENSFNGETFNMGVSNVDKEVKLYLNNKKNRGNHSTTKFAGREEITMKCRGINEVLNEYDFNKAKIDCEGEEYNILMAVKDWKNVERIRLEWHRRILKDEKNIKFNEIIKNLEGHGFEVICKRDGKGWVQMITAKKLC